MKLFIEFGTTDKANQFVDNEYKGIHPLRVCKCEVKVEWCSKVLPYHKLLDLVLRYGGTIYCAD